MGGNSAGIGAGRGSAVGPVQSRVESRLGREAAWAAEGAACEATWTRVGSRVGREAVWTAGRVTCEVVWTRVGSRAGREAARTAERAVFTVEEGRLQGLSYSPVSCCSPGQSLNPTKRVALRTWSLPWAGIEACHAALRKTTTEPAESG